MDVIGLVRRDFSSSIEVARAKLPIVDLYLVSLSQGTVVIVITLQFRSSSPIHIVTIPFPPRLHGGYHIVSTWECTICA